MSDDLKSDLQDIDGVGEATADKILAVLDDHDLGGRDPYVERAIEAANAGDKRGAAVYLQRAGGDD